MKIPLEWTVGHSTAPENLPEVFVPATVPGAVQLDWARAQGWPDYTYGDNFRAYAWMEDVFWHYQTLLDMPVLTPDQRLVLVCRGVDYQYEVRLGDATLYAQEGMFTPAEIDLTGRVQSGDTLEILVFPAPKTHTRSVDRSQADQSCKPAVSYGWDWHPRLIPLGLWDETFLEVRPRVHLQDAEVSYQLSEDFSQVQVQLTALLSEMGPGQLCWRLYDPDGELVWDQTANITPSQDSDSSVKALSGEIVTPRLWWPNGQGEAALYRSEITWQSTGSENTQAQPWEIRTGFRRIQLVMNPGTWREPNEFPLSRSHPPITLEVNGRQIFGKGTNWVNPTIFPGTITAETYRPLLEQAQAAHMNLLRIWGGGIVNKESFFDQCDTLGLMVWQEFPLACNNYRGTPTYLRILDQESRSIIQRLRRHACLALWCGGNELFNNWSGMTDQSLALRLLDRNCYDLDPLTPYLMTSPVSGMGHGCYLFRYLDGREVYQVMPKAHYTAYTEFGCPGPSDVDSLRAFLPPEDLFPPRPGTAWETHHGFNSWVDPSTWLMPELIEEYFGPNPDLETLVIRGQWMQAEGYKCIFEEARRQKPYCSMALNWCYNEPWPCAANNSLICWPSRPKPAYYAVAASCRPTLSSARLPKFRWREGELFCPELWLLHDGPEAVPAGRLEAWLEIGGVETFLLGWDFPELSPNENLAGPILRVALPKPPIGEVADRMTLRLRVIGHPEMDSEYVLRYDPNIRHVSSAGAPALNAAN